MNAVNRSFSELPLSESAAPSPTWMHVAAPGNESGLRPPALVAVEVKEGEEVDWIWTHLADGRRVVTGYRIRPRLGAQPRLRVSREGNE
jgi:hypothetical protein